MAPEVDSLQDPLRLLADRILSDVEILRAAGRLPLRRVRYTLRPDFSLRYSDLTFMNVPLETGEEDEWPWSDLEKFVTHQLRTTEEYERMEGLVQDAELLRQFSWRVAHEAAIRGIPAVDAHIAALIRDIRNGPQEYHMKLWLNGLTVAQDEIRVSDSLTLRRPRKTDFQEKVPEEMSHYAHAFKNETWFSCIADYNRVFTRHIDNQLESDRLINALRLFRLGSVTSTRIEVEFESFSSFARTRSGGPSVAARHQYELSVTDADQLRRFIDVMSPLIPSPYEMPKRPTTYLTTALHWYREALLDSVPPEGSVAWAVANLEALFLGDNPPSEITFRLTQRVISLLRCFGWAALEIKRVLTKAYEVRSKYVHGAVSKGSPSTNLSELFQCVADYARVGCVIWMQLTTQHRRDDILKLLDDALIDDRRRAELQTWCQGIAFATRQ